MKTNYCTSCKGYADRIAELEAENAALKDLAYCYIDPFDVSPKHEAILAAAIKAWREVTEGTLQDPLSRATPTLDQQ